MKALVKVQGRQIFVQEGQILEVNRFRDSHAGDQIELKEVLMVGEGVDAKVGNPFVEGVSVGAKILANKRGKKVLVIKRLRRKGAHKKQGHRQELSVLQIETIRG